MSKCPPLNVLVAQELGWTDVQSIGIRSGVERWVGRKPGAFQIEGFDYIPDFEHDWAALGPTIERLTIDLRYDVNERKWQAGGAGLYDRPLTAVCRALLRKG